MNVCAKALASLSPGSPQEQGNEDQARLELSIALHC